MWTIAHPRVDANPKGTGDLFTAALSAQWITGKAPPAAARAACAEVLQAMRLTESAHCAELLLPPAPGGFDAGEVTIRTLA